MGYGSKETETCMQWIMRADIVWCCACTCDREVHQLFPILVTDSGSDAVHDFIRYDCDLRRGCFEMCIRDSVVLFVALLIHSDLSLRAPPGGGGRIQGVLQCLRHLGLIYIFEIGQGDQRIPGTAAGSRCV